MLSFQSSSAAVKPVTAYSTPETCPSVFGRRPVRSVWSAAFDVLSEPLPLSGISTVATVPALLVSTSIGLFIWPLASAARFRFAIAAWTRGR